MKSKPDDRRDNVKKIQENINHTIKNIELAEDMMAVTDNPKTKRDLKEKNNRREEALDGMKKEIRDEVADKNKGYK